MTRRFIPMLAGLFVVAGSFFLMLGNSTLAEETKPNILFLFADDQRADTISAHGNPHIQTPNIDSLAKSGLSFRNNYIFGGNNGAVCVPSRAMLMSGKTWLRIDAPTLKGSMLLPEWLGQHGYETFATGKWHNGEASWLRAFQRGKHIFFGGMSDHTLVPLKDRTPDGKLTASYTGKKFSSELFADAAIEYLRERDRSKPFFAYVPFTAPHDPRQPPQAYRDQYYRNPPPLPPNIRPQLPFDNGMMKDLRDENLAAWPRTEAVLQDQLSEYYGMVTHMDSEMGRILKVLDQEGLRENTIIVYAADNGLALGSHGLLGKQSVYEHSMRVPLILVGKGIPKEASSHAFTYLLDLFPTLCDLAGLPTPNDLDGKSLVPLCTGKSEGVRDSIFLPYLDIQRAIRDDRWKLICYPKIAHQELFDLTEDPYEMINRIDDPNCREISEKLMRRMEEWQKECGDKVAIPKERRIPEKVDLSGKKRSPDQWQPEWIVKKYFEP